MTVTVNLTAQPILTDSRMLDTPALIVDTTLMQCNIDEMAALAKRLHVQFRPHMKTHKTPEIALVQIDAGAMGIMCAKLGEAEIMADGGIEDIAIGNQIVGEIKIRRLLALAQRAKLTVAVDSLVGARTISDAFADTGKVLDAYLEIDTGHHRAGVAPNDARVMAWEINRMPGLRMTGIMTHEGQANAQPAETIEAYALAAGRTMVALAGEMRSAGIPIEQVSVGSTPCAALTPAVPGVTEMRPGTFVFRDVAGFRYGVYGPDRCAARILATVTSRPTSDRAILDSGSKTLALDRNPGHPGHGFIVGHPTAIIERLNEEHATVKLPPGEPGFAIGDRVEIIPNHICPCVNLHDRMLLVRDGKVTGELLVAARGRVQ